VYAIVLGDDGDGDEAGGHASYSTMPE
jgi:hypothetical protein